MATLVAPEALNVIAIDDERIALDSIMLQLSRIKIVTNAQSFQKPDDALRYLHEQTVDVAFVDINMRGMDGLSLAGRIKEIQPHCAIVFLTGYAEYAIEAFKMKVHGYLLKPTTEEDIERELLAAQNRFEVFQPAVAQKPLVLVQTFGDFEVFVDGCALHFSRQKSKEVLAYLVDRRGAGVTSPRLAALIWEDKEYNRSVQKQIQTVISDMTKTLENAGVGEIVIRRRNQIAIVPANIECDCYRFLAGDQAAKRLYVGEYMAGYSWAEQTAGVLSRLCREM